MKIVNVTVQNWEKHRPPFLHFVKRYSNKNEFQWVYQIKKHHLTQPGTKIKLALWDGKIIAAFAFLQFGTEQSLFIISPNYQQTHIGTTLLKEIINELGVCYTRIPYTQENQMKIAWNAGMVAFAYTADPEERTVLWFGGGHWHINDIAEKEASSE